MGSSSRSRRRSWKVAAVVGSTAALTFGLIGVTNAFAATAFTANFEDGTTNGWSKSGGAWSVVTDGSKVAQQSNSTTNNARLFAGDSGWTTQTVQARVKPLSLGSNGFVGLLARAKGATSFYRLALIPGNLVQLQAVNSGAVTVLASSSRTVSTGTWYTLSITASGSTISGSVNGSSIGSASSSVDLLRSHGPADRVLHGQLRRRHGDHGRQRHADHARPDVDPARVAHPDADQDHHTDADAHVGPARRHVADQDR